MIATKVRILELTDVEKNKLQSLILGYGKLKEASQKCDLHAHTIRNVARLGFAEPETIEKLRKTILSEI